MVTKMAKIKSFGKITDRMHVHPRTIYLYKNQIIIFLPISKKKIQGL